MAKPKINIPSHATNSEMAVLGSMLLDKLAVDIVINSVKSNKNIFYHEKHQIIYQAILELFNCKTEIDSLTVAEKLFNKTELDLIGGAYYLTQLTDITPSSCNVQYYLSIVKEKYLRRQLGKFGQEISGIAFEENNDIFDELDSIESKIFQITNSNIEQDSKHIKYYINETIDNISKIISTDRNKIVGIPTGFRALDKTMGGLQDGDFIVIGGRPSMGKTAFALTMAKNMAEYFYEAGGKESVGFFSLEMNGTSLAIRLLAADAKIDVQDIRNICLSDNDFQVKLINASKNLFKLPLIIDENVIQGPTELRAKVRRMIIEHNIKIIFIDYLQLMKPPKAESREREVSIISQSLKQLAKEVHIPVVALSQLNRLVESRADKRPALSDLRDSGSLEQDADIVILVNRPEYYGIKTFEDKTPTENIAEIIIAKNRNGMLGNVKLSFLKQYAKFSDLIDDYDIIPNQNQYVDAQPF
jgi:replicative DNA helicase